MKLFQTELGGLQRGAKCAKKENLGGPRPGNPFLRIFATFEPLDLADHTVVQLSVETEADDLERQQWLKQGQQTLMGVWDNEADDVYNVLLTQ